MPPVWLLLLWTEGMMIEIIDILRDSSDKNNSGVIGFNEKTKEAIYGNDHDDGDDEDDDSLQSRYLLIEYSL